MDGIVITEFLLRNDCFNVPIHYEDTSVTDVLLRLRNGCFADLREF
jgi:hypothetical protein